MHEFKKKLLGTVSSDDDAKEKDNSKKSSFPDRGDQPQTPSSKSISQKLEQLRKAFQDELDQDDQIVRHKLSGKTPLDLQVSSLEKGLQDLRQAFRNEVVEKNNTNPISSEYLHRIERRLEILKKRLDHQLPEDGKQVRIEDFQSLEKRFEILRKLFDSELQKILPAEEIKQQLTELQERVNYLQNNMKEELLDSESADEIVANIKELQETVFELQKQFADQINEKLNNKANAYEVANLEDQMGELTSIIENIANTESSAAIDSLLARFKELEQKTDESRQEFLEKIAYLKKTFQSEFDNNTDARLLFKNLRELQNRFEQFESRQLSRGRQEAHLNDQKLNDMNKRFEYLEDSLDLKIEDKLKSSSVYSQVQILEQEFKNLKSSMLNAGPANQASTDDRADSFHSIELLINDFKKTVLVELSQKIEQADLTDLKNEVMDQIKQLRGKVQVALEHSENSRSITHEIQELGQVLVKIQKNEEDVKNQREEIASISEDLNAFAKGLNDLQARINSEGISFPPEIQKVNESENRENEVLKALAQLKNDFSVYKQETAEYIAVKSDKDDLDLVVKNIGSMFDQLKSEVLESQNRNSELEILVQKFAEIDTKLVSLDQGLSDLKSKDSEVDLSEQLNEIAEVYGRVDVIVAEVEELKKSHDHLVSEFEGRAGHEHFVTISEDIEGLEVDLKKLRSDFDVEFDKNTRLRAIADIVPQVQDSLRELRESTQSDLKEKVNREEFESSLSSYDSKLESSMRQWAVERKKYEETEKTLIRLEERQKKSEKRVKNYSVDKHLAPRSYAVMLAIGLLSGLLGMVVGGFIVKEQIKPQWEKEISQFRSQSEAKVDEMLSRPEVETLINEKARFQTEHQINNTFKRAIQIYVDQIKSKTDGLISQIATNSDVALGKLNEATELSRFIAEAQAGQRKAFDQLLRLAEGNSSLKESAQEAVKQIANEVGSKNSVSVPLNLDEFVVDGDYQSIENFTKIYEAMDQRYKATMLLELWNTEKLLKYDKINFLISEIRSTNNLILLARAMELVDLEAGLFLSLAEYESYLSWWEQNSARYFDAEKTEEKSRFFF